MTVLSSNMLIFYDALNIVITKFGSILMQENDCADIKYVNRLFMRPSLRWSPAPGWSSILRYMVFLLIQSDDSVAAEVIFSLSLHSNRPTSPAHSCEILKYIKKNYKNAMHPVVWLSRVRSCNIFLKTNICSFSNFENWSWKLVR